MVESEFEQEVSPLAQLLECVGEHMRVGFSN